MTTPLTTNRHAVNGTRLTTKPSRDKRATAFEIRYAVPTSITGSTSFRWIKVWTQTVEGGTPQMGVRLGGQFVPLDVDTVARLAIHRKRQG